jgi:hypothetical protein
LITNVCCVIDEINLLYCRKTQQDGAYQNGKYLPTFRKIDERIY